MWRRVNTISLGQRAREGVGPKEGSEGRRTPTRWECVHMPGSGGSPGLEAATCAIPRTRNIHRWHVPKATCIGGPLRTLFELLPHRDDVCNPPNFLLPFPPRPATRFTTSPLSAAPQFPGGSRPALTRNQQEQRLPLDDVKGAPHNDSHQQRNGEDFQVTQHLGRCRPKEQLHEAAIHTGGGRDLRYGLPGNLR